MDAFETKSKNLLDAGNQVIEIDSQIAECVNRLKTKYFESKSCPLDQLREYWAVADLLWKDREQLKQERLLRAEHFLKLLDKFKE